MCCLRVRPTRPASGQVAHRHGEDREVRALPLLARTLRAAARVAVRCQPAANFTQLPPSSLGRFEPEVTAPCSTAPRGRRAHRHHAHPHHARRHHARRHHVRPHHVRPGVHGGWADVPAPRHCARGLWLPLATVCLPGRRVHAQPRTHAPFCACKPAHDGQMVAAALLRALCCDHVVVL